MRIGSLARSRGRLVALLVAAASIGLLPLATFGQVRNASYDRSPGNQGPRQALYDAPAGSETAASGSRYVDANGNPMIVPAGFCDGCCNGGCGCDGCACGGCGPGCQGGYPGCCPMGAGGTDPSVGYDLMDDTGIEGNLVDQRGPHYFDIRAETVFLQRDKSFGKDVQFSNVNFGINPDPTQRLSTNQLDIEDPKWGFRIMGRYDICPLSVVEFGYTGIFDWGDRASLTSNNNDLFSLFSRTAPEVGPFGSSPALPVPVTTPGGPNPFTERATTHSIELSSDLQTAEISYRRYWLGYTPRVSGTLLGGFRYTRVNENFVFASQGSEALPLQTLPLAALNYDEECENNLAGFQMGGDIWVSLMQGVRVGSEAKVGIYDNHSRLTNRITSLPQNVQPPTSFEEFKDDHAAFISEGSVDVVFDILPSLSFRAGYEVLFLNELVLAGENFNQTSPYGNQGPRVPFVDEHGELFYHGGHVGFEYVW
jgi:Putative beta barrel porin-7 (BBP7)